MMDALCGQKCFLSSSAFMLTILCTYGVIGSVLNHRQVSKIQNSGEWPFNLRPILNSFVIIQALIPASGVFALMAVCRKQPAFLYCSGFVLMAVFTCCCIFGTVSIQTSEQDIVDEFYAALKQGFNDSKMISWMNDVQWKHKCCGVYSYMDWHILGLRAHEEPDHSVPSTCCQRETKVPSKDCGAGLLGSKESSLQAEKHIYTSGCGPVISKMTETALQRIGVEMWIAGLACLLVAIFLHVGVTKYYIWRNGNTLEFRRKSDSAPNDLNNPTSTSTSTAAHSTRTNLGNRANNIDTNNNNDSSSQPIASSFNERDRLRDSELQRKRAQKAKALKNSKRMSKDPGQVLQSKKPFFKMSSSSNKSIRQICDSKSFILGEVHSHSLTRDDATPNTTPDTNLLRKNVDMLWYQSLEKNMSTMSTTPDETSSVTVSGMLQNSALLSDAFSQRNTVYTLVSERPFTPSLSQNCSIPFVTFPNGDIGALGHCNPNPHSNGKQQRLTNIYPTQEEDDSEEILPTDKPTSSLGPTQNIDSADNRSNSESDNIEDSEKAQNLPPLLSSASAKYATSSVRSSTLATIHEESESVKGSPVTTKGPSPASGYMSPENVSPTQTTMFSDSLADTVAHYPNGEINNDTETHRDNNNAAKRNGEQSIFQATSPIINSTTVGSNENLNDSEKKIFAKVGQKLTLNELVDTPCTLEISGTK